jgi:arylsulfatase A-like enzyme
VRLTAVILGIGLLAFSVSRARAGDPPEHITNVIFILADDLGWTDLGCFGSDLYETPNVDRLAREGMRFTNAYSACTVCSPTRAAVMTGKYPARLHLTNWIAGHNRPDAKLRVPDWTKYLAHEQVTLAEALKPAGYHTIHIGKWHLGPQGYWPTDQGFNLNIAGYDAGHPPSYYWPYRRSKGPGIPTLKLTEETKGQYLTDRLAYEAARAIHAAADRPFFLYLPTYQVHTPIQPKKEYVAHYEEKIKPGMRHTNADYAAMIQSMDELVGKVLRTLDELKIGDRTAVFFTSDNGGLSHHLNTRAGPTINAPLRAGKGSAYEGGVRVPLIVRWPGVVRPGNACDEPVLSNDYYKTILEMAGTSGDERHNADVDGLSLVPLLKDPASRLARDAIYWHYPHYHPGGATPYGAIRSRDWKLVEFYEDDHVELYNLKDDLSEKHDLAATMPEKAGELRSRLHAWRDRVGAQMPTINPDYRPKNDGT